MRRMYQPIAVLILVVAILLLEAWALGRIPTYAKYCEFNQYRDHENCATYRVAIVMVRYIGWFLDATAPVITAIATGIIGLFTLTIWLVNRNQLNHGQQSLCLWRVWKPRYR